MTLARVVEPASIGVALGGFMAVADGDANLLGPLNALASSPFVALVLSLLAVGVLWRSREGDRVRYEKANAEQWAIVNGLSGGLKEANEFNRTHIFQSRRDRG